MEPASQRSFSTDVDSGIAIIGQPTTYRDGAEEALLDIMRVTQDRSSQSDEFSRHIRDWPTRYHLSKLRSNLLFPFNIQRGAKVLDIGAGTGALARVLGERGCHVTALEGALPRARVAHARCRDLDNVRVVCGPLTALHAEKFDVIFCIGVLEYATTGLGDTVTHLEFLNRLRELTKPEGSLVLAIENQLGLKYLLGCPEDHRPLAWLGIEGYPAASSKGIRTFSRAALTRLLLESGFPKQHWLYPFPDYKLPTVILDEKIYSDPRAMELIDQIVRQPVVQLSSRRLAIADDRAAHNSFLDAGLGQDVANSFLVVAGNTDNAKLVEPHTLAWLCGGERAAKWQRRRTIYKEGDEMAVVEAIASNETVTDGWLIQRRAPKSPFYVGPTLEQQFLDACATGESSRAVAVVRRWYEELSANAMPSSAPPQSPFGAAEGELSLPPEMLDANFENFIQVDGRLIMFDREWEAVGGVALNLAVARGLWYAAHRLVTEGHVMPWGATLSVGELVFILGQSIGSTLKVTDLQRMLEAEVELRALVNAGVDEQKVGLLRRLQDQNRQTRMTLGVRKELPFTRLVDQQLAAEALRLKAEAYARRVAVKLTQAVRRGDQLAKNVDLLRKSLAATQRRLKQVQQKQQQQQQKQQQQQQKQQQQQQKLQRELEQNRPWLVKAIDRLRRRT